MLTYPVGFPFWKLVARSGIPVMITIEVRKDEEAGVYIAMNPLIGLAVEADTLDALEIEVDSAIPELMSIVCPPVTKPLTSWRYRNSSLATA
jgi:hypothetical protein